MRKRLFSVGISVLLLAGCTTTRKRSPLPPEFYEVGTAVAVSYGLRNSPQTANYLRAVQPVLCKLATKDHLTPAEVDEALKPIAGHTPEGVLLVRGVQLLYIAAFNSVGGTNAPTTRPYADAIFCKGFEAGLEALPTEALGFLRSPKPTPWQWPIMPIPVPKR